MEQKQLKSNIVDLAEQLNSTVATVNEEEQEYLDSNLSVLKNEIDSVEREMPYPDVRPYDVASGYDEISDLQYKKRENKKYWDKLNVIKPYYNEKQLYVGHLQIEGQPDFFLMDNLLETKKLSSGVWLIASMDRRYDDVRRAWRFPKGRPGVLFSRNVTIKDKEVKNVELVFDTSNQLVSNISDSYLRNALIRNKRQTGIVSIIQTIQEKQDAIMTANLNSSFVVQGCAGSGKTVILLNRLRYLIFNKMLPSLGYSVLVPSEQFKRFILKAAMEYGINVNGIYTYGQYYSELLSERKENADEEVFSKEFLARVYSEKLVRECYKYLIKTIFDKVENLVDFSENKLNILVDNAVIQLTKERAEIQEEYALKIQKCIAPIESLLGEVNINTAEPKNILESAKLLLGKAVQNYNAERARISALHFTITEDEVSNYDNAILALKEDVSIAKDKASKSNIFTRAFRYRKLSKVRELYELKYKEIEEAIISAKREAMLNNDLDVLENGLTINELRSIVKETENVVVKYEGLLELKSRQIADPQSYVAIEYKTEGSILSEFLDYFEVVKGVVNQKISQLLTCNAIISELYNRAKSVYDTFIELNADNKKKGGKKQDIKIFAHKDVKELYGYFQMTLMTRCKAIIEKEFNVKLSDTYKYYSFLSLYFVYLVKGALSNPSKYIFIDEAQDLSVAELGLIYKLNNNHIMNMFGDVNQVITKHGMIGWEQADFILKKYDLDENFRNTNQVVDYCNSNLPASMRMKKIGVDMDEVETFSSVDVLLNQIKNLEEYSIIVKDESSKSEIVMLIGDVDKNNVYTVKQSKGLEFYKTIVFSSDMSDNEKYIAYTRSLNKLVVVEDAFH